MIEHPTTDPAPNTEPTPPIFEDDPPDRPWLRRIMKTIYIVIVLMVIVGLISLFFPWDSVDAPIDFPFRNPIDV